MKTWTAIGTNNEDPRWKALEESLRAAGVENEFKPWSGAAAQDFTDLSPLQPFDHVRVSASQAPILVKHVKQQSSWIRLIGVFDGLTKRDGEWWPSCALYDSFGQIIIELGQELDPRGSVMVAGAGGSARVAIAAFFKGGFKNFLLTSYDRQEGERLISEMRARFFGSTIEWVPTEGIVLLPGESSVLCNCTPSVEENALLIELSYLNFLKRPGFLFDLPRGWKSSLLVEEARDAGVRVIEGVELAARTDQLWAKWAFQAEIDRPAHLQRLRAAIS